MLLSLTFGIAASVFQRFASRVVTARIGSTTNRFDAVQEMGKKVVTSTFDASGERSRLKAAIEDRVLVIRMHFSMP